MSETKPEGDEVAEKPPVLPSYQPAPAGDAEGGATRARRTASATITADPGSTGSPTYVPKTPVRAETTGSPLTGAPVAAAPGISAATTTGAATAPAAARAADPVRTAAGPTPDLAAPAKPVARTKVRRTRKARLRIARVDPWSVMKTALLFGIAGGIIFVVSTYVVMSVIESTGVYQAINQVVGSMLTSPTDTKPFSIEEYVNTRRVTGLAALIGAVDVVILTALATVFSFLYNLSATMLGGLEITLAED